MSVLKRLKKIFYMLNFKPILFVAFTEKSLNCRNLSNRDNQKKMSAAVKFSSRLRELRIHLCQKGLTSKGARNFLNDHYLALKQTNPKCLILVRECEGIQPKLWARFDNGVEDVISLSNKESNEILKQLESMVSDTLIKSN